MIHVLSHFVVPVLVGVACFPGRSVRAVLLMLAAMAIDVDHLLAVPVYDPERCSIGFHPLHSVPAVVLYAAAFALPLVAGRARRAGGLRGRAWAVHVVGLGLLLHIALDAGDCLRQRLGG